MSDKQFLPKVEFLTNIPKRLVFPFGDAKLMPSRNPEWAADYLYTVEDESGTSLSLFASKYLHELLIAANVGKGGIADILKAEKKNPGKKATVVWTVDVIDPGTPITGPRVRGMPDAPPAEPQAAQAPQRGPAPAPGGRAGAEARLAELGAAYAACVAEAKGVWARASEGIAGELDHETVHSTATSFFIAITRESFDLSVFAGTHGESEGMKALRQLIEKIKAQPYLAAVREHFGAKLDRLPADKAELRGFYVELREAVKAATMAAADEAAEHYAGEDEPKWDGIGAVPPGSEQAAKVTGNRPVKPPEPPPHVVEVTDLAIEVYGHQHPTGPNGELEALLQKVTRKSGTSVGDLTVAQAKIVLRSLQNERARASA